MLRRGVSAALSLVGAIFLTRLVGPENYGLFTAALGIYTYVQSLGIMGVNVYLVRDQRGKDLDIFHLAFWWFLIYGVFLTLICCAIVVLAGHVWVRTEGFIAVSMLMLASVPFILIACVPQSIAEKNLDYRKVAFVEIFSQLLYYAVAIPLAWLGNGVWALVAGFWLSQLALALGYFASVRYVPRWYFSTGDLKHMLSYGFSQALSVWVYHLRSLTPAFLLLPIAGKEAAGYFALANRLLTILSFAYETVNRLAVPTFSRVQDSTQRLLRAITEAIQMQVLIVGVTFIGFGTIAPLLMPIVLGDKWNTGYLLFVYSILGIRVIFASIFSIQGWALVVKKRNWLVFGANASGAVALIALGYIASYFFNQKNYLIAFCISDILSYIPVFVIQHYGVRKHLGKVDYRIAFLWTMAVISGMLALFTAWWLFLVAIALLMHPASLKQIGELYQAIKASFSKRDAPSGLSGSPKQE